MMSEDDRYRQSTQYRFWSYTPSALNAQRTQTNALAAQRVRVAVARARVKGSALSSGDTSEAENTNARSGSAALDNDVECLGPEEELKLLWYYCIQTIALGDHLNLPADVKATAVQYLRRFYITNSIMTYAPADILKTALFFATKTENHYYRLSKFAEAIGKTKSEDVLASEFLLTQGLRFTFDVRHPFRALEGACMEINAMAEGDINTLTDGITPLPKRIENLGKRNRIAHGNARDILKTLALLTDVYFHYTPSQIMLASLKISDSELVQWYLSVKFPASEPAAQILREKVEKIIQQCVEMLQSVQAEVTADDKKEIKALSKKLSKCRNPEKIDLVGLQRAKREAGLDDAEEERQAKKRKLERERSEKEGEDIFGPSIKEN